jgi:hypothetical protein
VNSAHELYELRTNAALAATIGSCGYLSTEAHGPLTDCCRAIERDLCRLEQQLGECSGALQSAERQLELLRVQATHELVPGWVGIPTVEWVSIMGPNGSLQPRRQASAGSEGCTSHTPSEGNDG